MGKNRDAIRDVLRELRNHVSREEFAIFEDANTGRFVQFTDALLLDLPVPLDDTDTLQRAEAFFATCGLPVHRQESHDFISFVVECEENEETAADFAMLVFKEVHGLLDSFRLEIRP